MRIIRAFPASSRSALTAVLMLALGCASAPPAGPDEAAEKSSPPIERTAIARSTAPSVRPLVPLAADAPEMPAPSRPGGLATIGQLRCELESRCWAVRTDYDDGMGGKAVYRITARYESPHNQLYSEVSVVEGSDYASALRNAVAAVRAKLRLPPFSADRGSPACDDSARQRLEQRCWTYRIDYHRSGAGTSYEILARTHAPRELSGTRTSLERADSLEAAVDQVLRDLPQ